MARPRTRSNDSFTRRMDAALRRIRDYIRDRKRMRDDIRRYIRRVWGYRRVETRSRLSREQRRERWVRPYRSLVAIITAPIRLIQHRYCHTSKPTYIHAVYAIVNNLRGRVVGLYAAIHERVSRWRRPMVRSSPPRTESVRRFDIWLKKFAFAVLIRIIKIAAGWTRAKIEYVRVNATTAALRPSMVARIYARVAGRAEDYDYGRVRHCSTYAIISGLRYTGPRSAWYDWHRRYRICEKYCAGYDGYCRGICYAQCESILAIAEPKQLQYMLDSIPPILEKLLSRVGCT